MSYASRKPQSRAETEANARTLRALVKLPDNKHCADCKRNDTRWASWNIGCFLCIRCSGIHRSMGTHISRVKSIDLDIWTPEQMESIQKWGNKRANAYWEAHLKAGHAPPDHKVESFIRSKYELRRWAMNGPPPSNPSVLDSETASTHVPASAPAATLDTTTASVPSRASAEQVPTGPSTQKATDSLLDLLDDGSTSTPQLAPSRFQQPSTQPTTLPKTTTGHGAGLFDLDWDDTSPKSAPVAPSAAKTSSHLAKNDILSLFSAPSPSSKPKTAISDDLFTSLATSTDYNLPSELNSMSLGISSGVPVSKPVTSPSLSSVLHPSTTDMFNTQNIWDSTASDRSAPVSQSRAADDAFADIWSDFK